MRLALCCIAAIACAPVAAQAEPSFDYAAWDHLLKTYVDDQGRVDYAKLRASKDDRRALDRLVAQIAVAKTWLGYYPEREAFFIDAYNVLVWKGVIDWSPARVDALSFAFFHRKDFIVGGRRSSLDEFEKYVIGFSRKPSVHFALNCASAGCPELVREAFTPQRLDEQLEREAKKFCNDPRNFRYEPAPNRVTVSMLFKWYAADFANEPIAYCNARRPSEARVPKDATIEYREWDWRLNDRSLIR